MATFNSGSSNGYSLSLHVSENSTSIENNTSSISWTLQCRATSAYATWNPGPGIVTVVINGATVYNGRPSFVFPGYNSTITLCSGSLTVGHNADGSKAISCSASYTPTSTANYLPNSMSASGSMNLTTIARASTPNFDKTIVYFGEQVVINTPRASDNFTHTLKYEFSNRSGTIAENVGTSQTWELPIELADQLTDSLTGSVTIVCETYNGSTLIGTKSVEMSVAIPNTVAFEPNVDSIKIQEAVPGIEAKFKCFVQHKSRLYINVETSGAHGAKINTCLISVAGMNYSGTTVTTQEVKYSGNVEISVTVVDSRGKSATYSEFINVVEYHSPKIMRSTVKRCDVNGKENEDGIYLACEFEYSISSINDKNTRSFKIQKYTNDNGWVDLTTYEDAYNYADKFITSDTFSAEKSYEIRFLIKDYFGEYSIIRTVQDSYSLIHFKPYGLTLRKHATESGEFRVELPTFLTGQTYVNGGLTLSQNLKKSLLTRHISRVSVAPSSFTLRAGGTPTGYPYRAQIANSQVTYNDVCEVFLSQKSSDLGIISCECDSYNGGIYIYASEKPSENITINQIVVKAYMTI